MKKLTKRAVSVFLIAAIALSPTTFLPKDFAGIANISASAATTDAKDQIISNLGTIAIGLEEGGLKGAAKASGKVIIKESVSLFKAIKGMNASKKSIINNRLTQLQNVINKYDAADVKRQRKIIKDLLAQKDWYVVAGKYFSGKDRTILQTIDKILARLKPTKSVATTTATSTIYTEPPKTSTYTTPWETETEPEPWGGEPKGNGVQIKGFSPIGTYTGQTPYPNARVKSDGSKIYSVYYALFKGDTLISEKFLQHYDQTPYNGEFDLSKVQLGTLSAGAYHLLVAVNPSKSMSTDTRVIDDYFNVTATTSVPAPAPADAAKTVSPFNRSNLGDYVSTSHSTYNTALYLQLCLNKYEGESLATDGSCGPATTAAIKRFQTKYGLAVDGSFGPASMSKAEQVWK